MTLPDGHRKIRVLVCDDDPADRSLVRQLLKMAPDYDYEVVEAADGRELLDKMRAEEVDAVILDVQMPGKSGLEWLEEVNSLGRAPVVVATGHGDEMVAVEAMKAGAYDYLPKLQFSVNSLSRAILNAMERWDLECQVKAYRKELALMAMTDALTGVRNRRSLIEAIKRQAEGPVQDGTGPALIMFDIDHFKRINDAYGHDAGDSVLVGVCRTVEKALEDGALLGRYGGEEFIVVLTGKTTEEAARVAEECRAAVEGAPLIKRDGAGVFVTISLGVAAHTGEVISYEELIKRADTALYGAKQAGRNRVAVYGG